MAQANGLGPEGLTGGGFKAYGRAFGLGYGKRSGGAVTQITSRATGVTLNTLCGQITTDATSLAAAAEATFIVTNSRVKSTDVVIVCAKGGQSANTSIVAVSAVADGSFSVTITNLGSGADTGAMIINFAIIKSVNA